MLALAVPSLVHAQEAPANSSPAIAPKDEVVKLSPFEVRESTDKTSYRATESTSGSGIALPIRHIPVPIEVVTQALIEDRGALDLLSASYLVSGVVTGGPVLTGQESWRIHGYSAPGLRNGFRLDNDTTDASEIERIEVASGPASVLYGAGATGGAVNRITKKPKFVQEGRISAGFGDYDYYQGMIDVTGPVPFLERDGKPTLAYRAIVSTNNISSDVDWYERTRNAFNGSLRWQPTDRLNFTAEISSNQRKGRPSVEITEGLDAGGAIAYAKDPTGRGYSFSIAGPDSYDNMRGDAIEFTMDFHITDSLVLNAAYVDHDSSMQNLRSRRIDLFGRNLPAQLESGNEWVDQQLWRANLLWEWEGNGIDNKLVLGADGSTDHNRALVYRISNWVPPADYSITSAVRTALFSANPNTNRNRTTYLRSYRVVDFMNLLDNRLHILASVARTEPTKQKDTVTNTYVTLRGDTTMQAGVVYDFTRDISGFVNYSTDFVPNTQTGPTGNVLDPQEGVGIDFGLKFAMFDGQLTGSLSYFDEERTNIPLRIGQTSFFELSGKDRSRGFDFNFLYTPSPVWSLKFGGSIFEAETIANTADPTQVGLPPQDVCPRSLNFQSTWHGRGRMKGFSFGVGGIWHDDYPTESATNKRHVRTDDVALYDAFARYGFDIGGHVASFTVNVSNVSDKRAYIINQEAFGPPRMIRGTLRYDF